jgi:hypothetical protein
MALAVAMGILAKLVFLSQCHWFWIAQRYRTRRSNAFGPGRRVVMT